MQGSKELFRLLREIDPKNPYGTELFDALARLTVSVAVEAVCLRLNFTTREVEVYLTQRSPNDTAYPGEWHCPGFVMRLGEDFEDVFVRLGKKEFVGRIESAWFVANVNHPTEERGHFFSVVYLCTLQKSEGLRGQWFSVNHLPEKTVECHRCRVIPAAVGALVAQSTSICP